MSKTDLLVYALVLVLAVAVLVLTISSRSYFIQNNVVYGGF